LLTNLRGAEGVRQWRHTIRTLHLRRTHFPVFGVNPQCYQNSRR
jgi:hypothetical protein